MAPRLLRACLAALALLAGACAPHQYLDTFLTADGYQLTFVRPSTLRCDRATLTIDFTHNAAPGADVACNFTLVSDNVLPGAVQRLAFRLGAADTVAVHALKVLTVDESSARFTSKLDVPSFTRLVRCASADSCPCTALLGTAAETLALTPSSDFHAAMKAAGRVIMR